MTNQEWRRCKDLVKMIAGLREIATPRKSVLYMCAGCRSIWPLFYAESSTQAIEVAERFADGQATKLELRQAAYEAECPTFGYDFEPRIWKKWCRDGNIPSSVKRLVEMGVCSQRDLEHDELKVDSGLRKRLMDAANLAYFACRDQPFLGDHLAYYIPGVDWPGDWLLRCIFGKPFLPAITLEPKWMTPNVVSLAETIYQECAFNRMPILGVALEEVGCSSEEILEHCRSDLPHTRGCWVVDLLLGKC